MTGPLFLNILDPPLNLMLLPPHGLLKTRRQYSIPTEVEKVKKIMVYTYENPSSLFTNVYCKMIICDLQPHPVTSEDIF